MATTINHPLTKTIVSAEGSAEVIAYGTNDYTDKWSVNTDSDWSLWDTFPTVVRVGNFVWCWRETTANHTWYVLIDIVEDVGNEFGGNLAYPEITNTTTDSIVNILDRDSATISISTLTDGPYRPLAIGNKVLYSSDGIVAGFRATARSFDQFTPVLTNGTIESFHIGCNSNSVSNIPVVRGWGSDATKKGTNGDTRQGLFAPFATQEQFETLYGKEHNWQTPVSGKVWLFEAESGSGLGVYSGSLTYPFTVAAMVPNTKYRDIPGDTTGDGIDNTPSFETALTAFAVVAAVVPALDPTKCVGFPGDIKIPGIATDGISERLNDVKAGIESAISSTGLLDLEKKLEGFKARIESSLPKGAQIQNLAADIAAVDPDDFNAIDKLNEKWKDAVDNVAGYFDDIGGLDICSLIGLEGKTGADGKLVKKPELPSIPERDIEEPVQSVAVATPSRGKAQNSFGARVGLTPAKEEEINKEWKDTWETLRKDTNYIWAEYLGSGGTKVYEDNFNKFTATPKYVRAREAVNRKEPIPLSGNELEELKAGYKEVLVPLNNYIDLKEKFVWTMNEFYKYISIDGKATYFPTPDYDISSMIQRGTYLVGPVGIVAPGNFLGVSHMDQANRDMLLKFQPQMVEAIRKYFFSEEGIKLQLSIMAGLADNWSESIQNKIEDAINEGNEGDAADDSLGGLPTEDFKGTVPGQVVYKYKKDKIDPKTGRIKEKGTTRNQPIQPALFNIIAAAAAEKNYYIEIYSGGQDYYGTKNARREGSKRHDGGYAADIRVKTATGRRLSAHGTAKDIRALREFVLILLKNGATSIGAGDPFNYSGYMNGNLHVDIATRSPYKLSSACWGALGTSYRRAYAPLWLTSAFDNRV